MLVEVLEDYSAFFACELNCSKGDLFTVISVDDRWATVRVEQTRRWSGRIPRRLVHIIDEGQYPVLRLGNIIITDHDLATLAPKQWLNDEIINAVYATFPRKRPHLFVFSSFFHTKLRKEGYDSIRRWTKKVNRPQIFV